MKLDHDEFDWQHDEPYIVCRDHTVTSPPFEPPKLTVINFSGGKQSSAILWMILRGDLPRPANLVVLNADPGMENSRTYDYIEMMFEECEKAGIEAYTVDGPNLYKDLVELEGTRVDNPPYWTLDDKGKRGRLMQKCTKHYKIAPMNRAIRRILEDRYDISRKSKRLGSGIVEKWIGFSYDEADRIKPPSRKYVRFRYPLIELGMANSDVIDYYLDNELPIPDRSVCNACFANGLDTLKEMHDERPEDWEQAVEVDEAVRDMGSVGIRDDVYVSSTTTPLTELAENGFETDDGTDEDEHSCDQGYCFV